MRHDATANGQGAVDWDGSTPPVLKADATLDDYLAYAAIHNAGLEAAFYRWKAALEEIPQARAMPQPRVTYAEFIREVETRVGPQRRKLSVTQRFPLFGRLGLQGGVAAEAAELQRARYESVKLSLFHRVKRAYADLYYLARSIRITEENVQLLTYLESVARKSYSAGGVSHGAVIKAQVELGRLEDRLRALRDMGRPRVAALNAALGRSSTTPIPFPSDLPADPREISIEELHAELLTNSPDLKAIDARVSREEAAAALARRKWLPDVTIGADFIDTGEARMPGVADSGKDPIMAMVSIDLPLWSGSLRAEAREADARSRAALRERADRENGLLADLEMTFFQFEDAERRIDLYRNTLIPKAEQSLGVAEQAFAAGDAGFLDLIDAQRTLLEFDLALERARCDRLVGFAKLELLVGKEISQR